MMAADPLRSRIDRRATLSPWRFSRGLRTIGSFIVGILSAFLIARLSHADSLELRSDWRFSRGEVAGAEDVAFDDSSWAIVRVPHDWAIAGPFHPELDGGSARLPWRGIGWYRKSFPLDSKPGTRVYLDFDGVMAFPRVYVNGHLAGSWDYGYTSFRVDATPYVNLQGSNVVAVRVDTTKHGTRWYPGAGIYRKVTLQTRQPLHFAHWGIYVTTPEVSKETATVQVRATIENHRKTAVEAEVEFALKPAGNRLSPATRRLSLRPGPNEIEQTIQVKDPQLWDTTSPNQYALRATLRQGDSTEDVADTRFGIRHFQFTANDGFHLNGRRVQLYGVNLHHDHGPLGAAFNTRAMQRQLEIMREMGANAVRTSHNPSAPELLDLCDEMGMLVWDECFDKWNETAGRIDGKPTHREHAERHLRSMVMRDRNHPSIVVWSIGNEISSDREGVTPDRVKMMRDVVRMYDATRPVGIGCHIPYQSVEGVYDSLDLTGWNYARRYLKYRERYPDRPIVYSESASAISTRGFYELPMPKTKTAYSNQFQVDSYDLNSAPWSDIADVEFQLMQNDRYVAGEFVWTGFDYLGEPTPFERRAKNSYFGIVDLCGIPKDRYYLYRSHWRPDSPTVHILPHWNWPERLGQNVPVFVYTNGDSAELFLNGRSLGMQKKGAPAKRPANLASGRPTSASSSQPNNSPQEAADDSDGTLWSASDGDAEPWWQVDLGRSQPLECLILEFAQEAKYYGYVIQTSTDAIDWKTIVEAQTSEIPRWGGARTAVHDVDAHARYVRIEFSEFPQNGGPAMYECAAFAEPAESSYYLPTYDYRLRWNKVVYEPGELRAVAYKNGSPIGSATVRTAGEPAAIRLSPDRKQLVASGDDLCYVLVEAIDEDGANCPLADNQIHFIVSGPGEIAAAGNGNPLSLEPFQSDTRSLFFGKAMLIVRTLAGRSGEIHIRAAAEGLADGKATLSSESSAAK
jgi:beta-galactosidase